MNESMCERTKMSDENKTPDVAGCPMDEMQAEQPPLEEDVALVFLQHKRVITQYSTDASGVRELHLYYGEKEISFDEPDLFAFGEGLAKHERFIAREATTWGSGYKWARVRELLEQLIREGILAHANPNETSPDSPRFGSCPSPLPPAKTTVPRTWFESEAIMRELTGRPLEVGYLELVIPVSHVAHIELDAEGRQVGEANVFPPQLRLDVSTEWRTCPHAGSRYLDPKPMNVTALKSMRKYWPQMMVALGRIRDAYLRRFPQARQGWTVGDLQRLATLVLAVPGYLLMRSRDRVENGQLHPVLSCMFRVTDGVRMTTLEMLYRSESYEPIRMPDEPMTSAEIYAYAERNQLFHSSYGVCAGPKTMIEEFFSVLVDGRPIDGGESVSLDPSVQAALNDLDEAFDYGLYGLQSYAIVYSLWPAMRHTYEQLLGFVEGWSGESSELLIEFRERLQRSVQFLQASTRLTAAELSAARERVYADMYTQCTSGLGSASTGATFAASLAPAHAAQHMDAVDQLRALLRQRLWPVADRENPALEDWVACVMDYLRQEQAIVRRVCEIQQRINLLLERPLPRRPLTASDLHLFYLLKEISHRQPYLPDDLEEILGLHIVVTQDSIMITDRTAG